MFDMTRKSEEEFKAIKAEAVETERERKNGASGKLANVKALEVEGLISRIRNEYFHDDYPEYIRTGFTEFYDCIKGFRRGETYLLAARPEMGKTAFALSVLDNQIREGVIMLGLAVGVASLLTKEENRDKINEIWNKTKSKMNWYFEFKKAEKLNEKEKATNESLQEIAEMAAGRSETKIEENRMVSEGVQTTVNYFNESQDEDIK